MSENAAVNSRKRPHPVELSEITGSNKSIHLDSGQTTASITSKSDDSNCINCSSGEEYIFNDNSKDNNIHSLKTSKKMEEASEGFSVLDLNSENSGMSTKESEPLLSIKFRDRKIESTLKGPILQLINKVLRMRNHDTVHKDLELNIWPEDIDVFANTTIDTADSVSEILNTSTGSEDGNDTCGSKNIFTIDVEGDPDDIPMGIFPELPPEKLADSCSQSDDENDDDDSLFMIDTSPATKDDLHIPAYCQRYNEVMQPRMEESNDSNQPARMGICFNCDGSHVLRDCPEPRDNARISRRRQAMAQKVGRYHMEDDQRFAHFVPGRISHSLRDALGLHKNQLPLHVYRMRLFGYPPGWLEDHKVTHSGISMFDSQGNQVMCSEDEEGEIATEGSRDKFDIKKIISFPGFNVPASSSLIDEAEYYGMPQLSEYHSKQTMISFLAPNAAVAYKKRKLKQQDTSMKSPQTEKDLSSMDMDVDCDEDSDGAIPGFVPPLPSTPQALPPLPSGTPPFHLMSPPPLPAGTPPSSNIHIGGLSSIASKASVKNNKLQIVIPLSEGRQDIDTATHNEESQEFQIDSPSSPSLSDLEARQRILLEALDSPNISKSLGNDNSEQTESEDVLSIELEDTVSNTSIAEIATGLENPSHAQDDDSSQDKKESINLESEIIESENILLDVVPSNLNDTIEENSTSDSKDESFLSFSGASPTVRGHVRSSSLGTPILKSYTPYSKLPNAQHFSKDIADVINFENLPDSTGKYEKMKGLICKVRTIVEKLQSDS